MFCFCFYLFFNSFTYFTFAHDFIRNKNHSYRQSQGERGKWGFKWGQPSDADGGYWVVEREGGVKELKEEKEQKRKTEQKRRLDGLNSQHLLANIIFSPVSFAIIIECKLWL